MNSIIFVVLMLIVIIFLYGLFRTKPKSEAERAEIQAQLELIKEKLELNALDSIQISLSASPPKSILSSKFGGYAAWPKSRRYPKDKSDNPLRLLAQINLSELPENNSLPSSGILQFFIANDPSWGLEFESQKRSIDQIIADSNGYQVIYHKGTLEDLQDLEFEFGQIDYRGFPFEGECALTFELVSAMCSPCDYRFEKIVGKLNDIDDDVLDEVFEQVDSGGCRIGGYATFTQDDPRSWQPEENWLLLFQMDSVSEQGFDIMWGDVGVANFFIKQEDLSELIFDNIWYNWDCC